MCSSLLPLSFSHFTCISFLEPPHYHHPQCLELTPKRIRAPTTPHTMVNIISPEQISLSVYVYLRSNIMSFALSDAECQQVEDTLFRIHRYFLTRDSAYFRTQLPHPPSPGDSFKGSSDNNPLVLEGALKVDFERFLWVFYNP